MLDRLLQRQVTVMVEVPATMAFAYDAQELQSGRIDDGEWRRDSDTVLGIGLNDSNGLVFPFPQDLTLPVSGVEVAFDGAAGTILTLKAFGGTDRHLRYPSRPPPDLRWGAPGGWYGPGYHGPVRRDTDGHADGYAARVGTTQRL